MCIPHAPTAPVGGGYVKKERAKREVKKVSQREFEKGDPNFVDERKKTQKSEENEESFLSSLFKG